MSEDALVVNIIFDGKNHEVKVANAKEATVLDLMQAIQKCVCVPWDKQRVIYKGKSLVDIEALIHSTGITNGSKLMVLGSVEKLDPKQVEKLSSVKESSQMIADELKSLENKLVDQNNLSSSDVSNCFKHSIDLMERSMKNLELLDTIRLPFNCEVERKCRKDLATQMQDFILQADELKKKILKLHNSTD